MIKPKEVKRLGSNGIEILWEDGSRVKLSSKKLRSNCPSAKSLAERGDTSHDKPLSGKSRLSIVSSSAAEELLLEEIWLVGNYALGMRWADGHDSGIYTFPFLYGLGRGEVC